MKLKLLPKGWKYAKFRIRVEHSLFATDPDLVYYRIIADDGKLQLTIDSDIKPESIDKTLEVACKFFNVDPAEVFFYDLDAIKKGPTPSATVPSPR